MLYGYTLKYAMAHPLPAIREVTLPRGWRWVQIGEEVAVNDVCEDRRMLPVRVEFPFIQQEGHHPYRTRRRPAAAPRASAPRSADEGIVEDLIDALAQCLRVLDSKELNACFSYLAVHGYEYTGPVADTDKYADLLARARGGRGKEGRRP